MISLQRKERGFTIVELLIVIVVIGILAALVITTFSGIQKKARDSERQTDINAVHGQVEAYYAQNGKYPTLTDLQTASFISGNLKGLDISALKDPKLGGTTPFPVQTATSSNYGYNPTKDDGSSCDNSSGNECTKYTLVANLEAGGTYQKTSLN
jgi:prepilin-type N-terminal cleavage/methylation domain-containing protein